MLLQIDWLHSWRRATGVRTQVICFPRHDVLLEHKNGGASKATH